VEYELPSALVAAEPTAQHVRAAPVPVHETPSSWVTAAFAGFGLLISDHVLPFQRATNAEPDVKLLV
jgi:hypothetical protein